LQYYLVKAQRVLFSPNFVKYLQWSSIKWFSQIWLHRRHESWKKSEYFYILGYLLELIIRLWRFGVFFNRNQANLSHFSPTKNPFHRSKLENIFFSSNFGETVAEKWGDKYWVKLVSSGAPHFQRFSFGAHVRSVTNLLTKLEPVDV
jgi:hypothetical protein